MSEFVSEKPELSSECEACNLLKRAAVPQAGESVKSAINRVARQLRWNFARTKAIWYGEARRIDAHEMDKLRQLAAEQAQRYRRLADAMRNVDPEFYDDEIVALVSAAQKLGAPD